MMYTRLSCDLDSNINCIFLYKSLGDFRMSTYICMYGGRLYIYGYVQGMRSCIDGANICPVSLSYFIAIGKANCLEIINPKRSKQLQAESCIVEL